MLFDMKVKPGYSIEIFVEDELYILNDDGKTIRVIRPHRVINVEGPEQGDTEEKYQSDNK